MELKRLQHAEIDSRKWDNAILQSDFPCVFASSTYLNAVCPHWKALVLGNYEAVMPLTENKKYGITYLYQPHFTPQLGVFMKTRRAEVEQRFFTELQQNYLYTDIECHAKHISPMVNALKTKTTYVLEPAANFNFNQNTKRNIKKALAAGLHIEVVTDTMALKLSSQCIHPFLKTSIGLKPKAIQLFKTLIETLQQKEELLTLVAYNAQETPIALAHFASNKHHAVYLKGVQLNKTENNGSMHLLMQNALNIYAPKNVWFDFGGGQQSSMAQFYKGFGAQPQTYYSLRINRLPYPLKWLR